MNISDSLLLIPCYDSILGYSHPDNGNRMERNRLLRYTTVVGKYPETAGRFLVGFEPAIFVMTSVRLACVGVLCLIHLPTRTATKQDDCKLISLRSSANTLS